MKAAFRTVSLFCALGCSALALVPSVAAQEPPVEDAAAAKARAKEERIAEYLKKKEEQRLRREMAREEGRALDLEREQLAATTGKTGAAAAPTTAAPATAGEEGAGIAAGSRSSLPRDLARVQANVRRASIATDPTVQSLLQQIDEQRASPYQLAAFGNFVSENGLHREGLEYYRVALRLAEDDPVLWVNMGTLHRKLDEIGDAASAYQRAIALDPNYALAHYNLGAILDGQGKYERAIREYTMALRLDPTLGDPAFNPQAATNPHLTAVRVRLYEEHMGTAGLPLAEIPTESPGAERP